MSDVELKGDIRIDSSRALKDLEKLSAYFDNIYEKINKLKGVFQGSSLASSINQVNRAATKAINDQSKAEIKAIRDRDREERLSNSKYKTALDSARIRQAVKGLSGEDVSYKKSMSDMRRYYKNLERINQSHGSILDKLFTIRNVIAAIAASELVRWVSILTDISNQFISVNVRFQALAKNSADAAYQMNWIYKTAKEMRQPILDAAEGYSKFFAAARSTIPADQIQEIYKSLLMTSTVMHIQPHQFKLVSLAIEQMASKGVISMEELRRQLGEHIPGAFGIAARAMGKTEKEFNNMVKNGEVFSTEFLPKFAKQLQKEFGTGLDYALQSPQSKLIAMQNALTELARIFSEGGFSNAVGNFADSLRKLFESDSFTKGVAALGKMTEILSTMLPLLLSLATIFGMGALASLPKGLKVLGGTKIGGAALGRFGSIIGAIGGKAFWIINIFTSLLPTIVGFFQNGERLINMLATEGPLSKEFWNLFWKELYNIINRALFGLLDWIMGFFGKKDIGNISSVERKNLWGTSDKSVKLQEQLEQSYFGKTPSEMNMAVSRGEISKEKYGAFLGTIFKNSNLISQLYGTNNPLARNFDAMQRYHKNSIMIGKQEVNITVQGNADENTVDKMSNSMFSGLGNFNSYAMNH